MLLKRRYREQAHSYRGIAFQIGMGGGLETQWVLDHHVDPVNVIAGLRLVGPV